MPSRFGFTPSTIPSDSYVVATCAACGGHRYVTRALMLEKAGDIPLDRIASRLRCIERRGDKRGPACGGRMSIELVAVGARPPEANAAWPNFGT